MFKGDDYGRHELSRVGYPIMKDRMSGGKANQDFFWLADMQENLREPLYVDQVHYSPKFSRMLAERIADILVVQR
jgi:hypothetical protein